MPDWRIEEILESIDEFSCVDRQWRYIYINRRALRRIQRARGEELTREDLLGKSIWELYPELVGTPLYQELHRALREQQTAHFEGYSSLSDRWVEVHAYPLEEGLSLYSRDISERKRAEEQLSYQARLLENVHDAVIATDEQLLVTAWNKGAEEMYGWRVDEVLGSHLWEVVPTDLGEEQRAEALRELAERGRFRTEALTYGKDGTPVWVEGITIALREEPDGEITGYVNIRRDISERKRAEEALRETETRYRTLVEQIPAVTYIQKFGKTNESTYVSPQMEAMLGYKPEECTSDPYHWIKIMHPADRERVLAEDRRTNESGEPFRMEFRQFARDGRVVWVRDEAVLVRDEEGNPSYWLGVQHDITERKQAQKEIERRTIQQTIVSEVGLRALASNDLQLFMEEAVVFVALTLGVEYCKIAELLPGGEEVLVRAGVGWEEGVVGSVAALDPQTAHTLRSNEPVIVEDLSTDERFEPAPRLVEHGVVSGITVVIQGRERPFGTLGAHSRSHRTFSGDDANFLQAVANVLATAIEREGTQDRVEAGREAERSRMARDLHDEALQDLTDALVQLQQIQRTSEDPQQTLRLARLLATLDRMGPQLRGAIYDLRLEGEQTKLFPELLEALVELHRGMAPESDITLAVHDGVLVGPLGERGRQLLRMIGEALTNVRRHSGAKNVRVGVGITGEKLWAEVSDDGRGFDPAQEENPEGALSATGGLGIRGMRERARAIGGDLKIESDPETGTRVRFEMPLTPEREEPEEVEGRVRVLLVEDHAAVREAIASTFQREEGFEEVAQAGSLEEAREKMLDEIDVAVIDLGLPDGYGGDLIRDLREANPQAQALVLSASLERSEIARAVEAGAAGVLSKTAHLDEVVKAVKRLRAGEPLMALSEVVELLRFAGSRREEEIEARRLAQKLTPREVEVLEALAEGLGSQQIADRLHISLRTERNHMASILAKLGVHSQLQALVFALRYGIVEIPEVRP